MNKPKRQGTAFETWNVDLAKAFGYFAERIAEGGAKDIGDVRVTTWADDVILECKHRDRLNIHEAVAKAKAKAEGHGLTAVVWKRSTMKAGNNRRSQVGVPIVAMTIEDFYELLGDNSI